MLPAVLPDGVPAVLSIVSAGAGWNVLMMAQVTCPPLATVIWLPTLAIPSFTHCQSPAAYPAGPADSDSV